MDKRLLDVKAQVLTCLNCDLTDKCRQPIPIHTPNPSPRFMVLGEAPGQVEDRQGLPFVGPAGTFLKRSLRKAGLHPTDGAYFNAVSCFPKERKTPTSDEMAACRRNLFDQLHSVDALHVLVCGSIALKSLLPHADITYASGMPILAHGKWLFPVYHPSYILRTRMALESWERQLKEFFYIVTTNGVVHSTRCIYCNAGRMGGQYTCQYHEKWWAQDTALPKFVTKVEPHPTLF